MMAATSQLKVDEVGGVERIVRKYPYLFDGQYSRDVAMDRLAEAWLKRLEDNLRSGTSVAFVSSDRHESNALAVLERLTWDSQHFGIAMMRLELVVDPDIDAQAIQELVRDCLRFCSEENIAHMAVRAPTASWKSQQALLCLGFRPVAVKLMLRKELQATERKKTSGGILYDGFAPEDTAGVRALAAIAMTDSRFHRDGRFAPNLVSDMYVSWIEQIRRRLPNQIVVAKQGNDLVGFIAYEIGLPLYGLEREELGGRQLGFVALVAVADRARGQGIGRGLILESSRRMVEAGCAVAYANVMLGNVSSVNAFLGTGFTLMNSLNEFHLNL